MAVYTRVTADALAAFLNGFDVGAPLSFKGIAEGVENSNYLLETEQGRYILTLYEKRVETVDLPYFLALMQHAATRGVRAARPIADREGKNLHQLAGRPAALIEFLPGLSLTRIDAEHAGRAGRALAGFHRATADFRQSRQNTLGLAGWQALWSECCSRADSVTAGLGALIDDELTQLAQNWPQDLPRGTCHTDLFPDNILFSPEGEPGLIDFYFACTDLLAYDLGVMINSWGYDEAGKRQDELIQALIAGYESLRPLTAGERSVLRLLCRGSALRFLLTRLYDWLNPVPGATVRAKDPRAFLAILEDHRKRARQGNSDVV